MNTTLKNTTNNYFLWLKNYWPCLLIILAIVGFVSKSLYNYPIGIMALLGLYNILLTPKTLFQDKTLKLFLYLFLCLWLPLLISLPDAVNLQHSAKTVFPYLRFFFAGVFIINELSKDKGRVKLVITGIFYIVFFWCIDATIQFVFNKNIFGFPYQSGHITGMFYPRNTIAHICSILSGLSFLYIYYNFKQKKWLLLSLLPLFFVVLLSGRRAAWIMLALSSLGFFVYLYSYSLYKKKLLKFTAIVATCIGFLLISTIVFHGPTHDRFRTTLGLFSTDYETIDKATALRLPLWETAYTIFRSNPVNGIGPRGYRDVYTENSQADDFWHERSQTHPHLLVLEILAETGLIGFLGYLIIFYVLIKNIVASTNRKLLLPFLIPVLVALFPFNAHMAFYGSIWSSMTWLLISLYFANAKLIINNERLKQ